MEAVEPHCVVSPLLERPEVVEPHLADHERVGGNRADATGELGEDVQEHAEASAVRGVDELRQSRGTAVGRVRRRGVETVVTPATLAREGGDGHQLECGDAERAQLLQARDDAGEGAFRRERADVELVDDELVELELRAGRDLEGVRVEEPRGAANALALPARAGIGPLFPAVEHEAVVVARRRSDLAGPEPAFLLREGVYPCADTNLD